MPDSDTARRACDTRQVGDFCTAEPRLSADPAIRSNKRSRVPQNQANKVKPPMLLPSASVSFPMMSAHQAIKITNPTDGKKSAVRDGMDEREDLRGDQTE